MIQLELWPDPSGQVPLQCPHCGTVFDALPQLKQHRARVLDDPRVRALPSPSKQFLIAALPILLSSPEPVGPRVLAGEMPYSLSSVSRQLNRLVDFGVVLPLKMRAGGKYHRYKLAIS